MADCQIRQYLSVKLNTELLQAADKAAVRETALLCRSFDPDDPEPSQVSLSGSPVAVGIDEAFLNCFLGCTIVVAFCSPISFGHPQDF